MDIDLSDVETYGRRVYLGYQGAKWTWRHRKTIGPVGLACALAFGPTLSVMDQHPERQALAPPLTAAQTAAVATTIGYTNYTWSVATFTGTTDSTGLR